MLALCMMLLESETDQQQFLFLYNNYHCLMQNIAQVYFPQDLHLAEDAVQESLLKIITHFDQVSSLTKKELPGYLAITVKNTSIQQLRKQKRLVLTNDFSPYDRPEKNSLFSHLVSIIRAMPETYRAALEMRFVLEMTHKEISKALGISETAAANRVSRGRKLLIEKLKEEGYEP